MTAAVLLILVAGCADAPASKSAAARSRSYIGVYEPGTPESYTPVSNFGGHVGVRPGLVLYYSGWPERFRGAFADEVHAHGGTPLVQIDPTNIDLAAIAGGTYDSYIAGYARAVHTYGHTVVIGFGHEMNGTWYSWAWHHTSPAVWIAAWRHLVQVFRRYRATNVKWMWTLTRNAGRTGPIQQWWPGSAYVDWVGIDGYYYTRQDDFNSVFSPTIGDVHKFTQKPILISEVGIGPVSGQAAKIPGLFAGVKKDHLLGLVWFDVHQSGGPLAQDWRLEGDEPAEQAFRRSAARM
jgi:hypothetical protein